VTHLGAALNRLSQRSRSDYVYYDYYGRTAPRLREGGYQGRREDGIACCRALRALADKPG